MLKNMCTPALYVNISIRMIPLRLSEGGFTGGGGNFPSLCLSTYDQQTVNKARGYHWTISCKNDVILCPVFGRLR